MFSPVFFCGEVGYKAIMQIWTRANSRLSAGEWRRRESPSVSLGWEFRTNVTMDFSKYHVKPLGLKSGHIQSTSFIRSPLEVFRLFVVLRYYLGLCFRRPLKVLKWALLGTRFWILLPSSQLTDRCLTWNTNLNWLKTLIVRSWLDFITGISL